MTNTAVIFVAEGCPGGEKAIRKSFTNYIYINLRGRDFRGPNYWFVLRQDTSHNLGTNVSTLNNRASLLPSYPVKAFSISNLYYTNYSSLRYYIKSIFSNKYFILIYLLLYNYLWLRK